MHGPSHVQETARTSAPCPPPRQPQRLSSGLATSVQLAQSTELTGKALCFGFCLKGQPSAPLSSHRRGIALKMRRALRRGQRGRDVGVGGPYLFFSKGASGPARRISFRGASACGWAKRLPFLWRFVSHSPPHRRGLLLHLCFTWPGYFKRIFYLCPAHPAWYHISMWSKRNTGH